MGSREIQIDAIKVGQSPIENVATMYHKLRVSIW